MSKYSEQDVSTIIDLHYQGYSNRYIARELLGRESLESTVRYILSKAEQQAEVVPKEVNRNSPARILIVDIETAPCIGFYFRRFKTNISQSQVIKESYVITWAAKWLDSQEILSDSLVNHSLYKKDPEDDRIIVESLAELLNKADIVVAHYGKAFDIPVVKTRMLYHGMDPIKPFHIMDTCITARREFNFPSNSLASLGAYLGLGAKVDHEGFDLWKKVVFGDMDAWARMLEYNIGDITLLEDVYLALRPWDTRHPNVGIYGDMEEVCCPCCGSTDVELTGEVTTTHVSKFPVIKCNSCGAQKSSRFTTLNKEQRNNILRNPR